MAATQQTRARSSFEFPEGNSRRDPLKKPSSPLLLSARFRLLGKDQNSFVFFCNSCYSFSSATLRCCAACAQNFPCCIPKNEEDEMPVPPYMKSSSKMEPPRMQQFVNVGHALKNASKNLNQRLLRNSSIILWPIFTCAKHCKLEYYEDECDTVIVWKDLYICKLCFFLISESMPNGPSISCS